MLIGITCIKGGGGAMIKKTLFHFPLGKTYGFFLSVSYNYGWNSDKMYVFINFDKNTAYF